MSAAQDRAEQMLTQSHERLLDQVDQGEGGQAQEEEATHEDTPDHPGENRARDACEPRQRVARKRNTGSHGEGRRRGGEPRLSANGVDKARQRTYTVVATPQGRSLGVVLPRPKPDRARARCGRSRRVRPKSKPIKKITKEKLKLGRLLYPEAGTVDRPETRATCTRGVRPCPWVGCRYNLYLDVNPDSGTIKYNFPDVEPWDLTESCSLDVAEESGCTLEEVAVIMNMTRERVRQIEEAALVKLDGSADLLELSSWEEDVR